MAVPHTLSAFCASQGRFISIFGSNFRDLYKILNATRVLPRQTSEPAPDSTLPSTVCPRQVSTRIRVPKANHCKSYWLKGCSAVHRLSEATRGQCHLQGSLLPDSALWS